MNCPLCKKEIIFFKGDIWINDRDYRVKILDYGSEDVWLLYLENQNKVAWNIKKFLEEYYILMQFTGLKDKNGKEIYEGDIVRHRPIGQIRKPEILHQGKIIIEPTRGVCIENLPLGFEPEVIGNIYENPELLK